MRTANANTIQRTILVVVCLILAAGSAEASSHLLVTDATARSAPGGPAIVQPGEDCATAIPLSGMLPIIIGGTTEGYADDYDEACPYDDSVAPDVVYAYTSSANVTVTVTLCTGVTDYDTKLYVYENVCPYTGNPIACNDDGCRSSSGQQYVSVVPALEMVSGSTYYIVVDGYGAESGEYELSILPAPACPREVGVMLGQSPELDAWVGALSDETDRPEWSTVRYENFGGLGGATTRLRFWGLNQYYDWDEDSWFPCYENPMTFEIAIYEDSGGWPGPHACAYTLAVMGVVVGHVGYEQQEVYQYVVDLPTPCVLRDGWVSIRGVGGPNCWFLWLGSDAGDGYSLVNGFEGAPFDLSLCVSGSGRPAFGACCDEMTGDCQEHVALHLCGGRFVEGAACDDLDPPCGHAMGACCDADGCTILSYAACAMTRPETGDANCDGVVNAGDINAFVLRLLHPDDYAAAYPGCPDANCDCDGDGWVSYGDINPFVALLLGRAPGMWLGPGTTCGDCPVCVLECPDGAIGERDACGEDTNSGCDMPPGSETFEPLGVGQTICGTLWAAGGEVDADWFEIEITESMQLTLSAESASPCRIAFLVQGKAGVAGCVNLTGKRKPSVYVESCEEASITTVCLPPGTYYALIEDSSWLGQLPCGFTNDYVVTLTGEACTIPVGACCLRDGSCVEVSEAQCAATSGEWEGAETECATTDCYQPVPGDSCDLPVTLKLPVELPFVDTNTTSGRPGWYDNYCLGEYGEGREIVYLIQVGELTSVSITLEPNNAQRTALALTEACPPGGQCIATSTRDWSEPHGVDCITLEEKDYYLIVDTGLAAIGSFVLRIEACTPAVGRCCHGDPVECAEISRYECDQLGGIWDEALDCNTPCELLVAEECGSAFDIAAVPYAVEFDNTDNTADGPRASCDKYGSTGLMQNDVWFTWTPASDCVAIASATAAYDAVLVVRDGCDAINELFCADDSEGGAETLAFAASAGVTYFFQIGKVGTHAGGGLAAFTLDCVVDLGACCYANGVCEIVGAAECVAAGGDYVGDGTACDPDPCPPAPGDTCASPIVVTVDVASLPFVDVNWTTGRGNDYEDTCLGSYDSGQDIIYELNVNETTGVIIKMDPRGTDHTAVLLTDECPPGPECIARSLTSGTDPYELKYVLLVPGTYYVMVDKWHLPDDIAEFELRIDADTRTGACCVNDVCVETTEVGACLDQGGRWYPGETCPAFSCTPGAGDDCSVPVALELHSNMSFWFDGDTCGQGNAYAGETCLGLYDNGQEVVYELIVSGGTILLDVSLNAWDFSWDTSSLFGLAISEVCPPGDTCLAVALSDGVLGDDVENLELAPGTYYLTVDTHPMRHVYPTVHVADCGEFQVTIKTRPVMK